MLATRGPHPCAEQRNLPPVPARHARKKRRWRTFDLRERWTKRVAGDCIDTTSTGDQHEVGEARQGDRAESRCPTTLPCRAWLPKARRRSENPSGVASSSARNVLPLSHILRCKGTVLRFCSSLTARVPAADWDPVTLLRKSHHGTYLHEPSDQDPMHTVDANSKLKI
jgi:hypothetical protein